MKKIYITTIMLLLVAFELFAQKPKEIVHYNIIFAPDLSNRLSPSLYPKAVNDADIVEGILKNIWPTILKAKRSDGQLDHYQVDFINRGLIAKYHVNSELLNIDFQRFEKQSDRINYIMGRKVTQTLPKDIASFMLEYKKLNDRASKSNNGADIWSYFQSGIDERIVLPNIIKGKVTHKFRNIMIIFTDGYIEAGIYGKGYDLSSGKVSAFRKAFLKSKEQNIESFLSKNSQFKIKAVTNPFLKNLEVIVTEMYDRSLSKAGAATMHPTDMEIMKVIWTNWMKSSGVKKLDLKPAANSKSEVVKFVMDFIKN